MRRNWRGDAKDEVLGMRMMIGGEQPVRRREREQMRVRVRIDGERRVILLLSEGVVSVESGGGLWLLDFGKARDLEREHR